MIKLRNPKTYNGAESTADIIDFPISECEMDANENPVRNPDNTIKYTGRTLAWTLRVGEEAKFPKYVADYLLNIYGFLEVVPDMVKPPENQVVNVASVPGTVESGNLPQDMGVAKAKEGMVTCGVCQKQFGGTKGLALHYAISHSQELLKKLA
jgi:hypothetical protein